jgi:nicotinamide mononucleotide transporter
MQFNLETILDAFAAMPAWEIVAVVFGIAYVLFAAKESLWAWFFAFFGTLIYTILFWDGALLSSAILNFYYMIMAVYGFVLWRGGKHSGENLAITSWSFSKNFIVIMLGVIVSLVAGYLSATYTPAKFAYLDGFVMIFSVIATWMLANKVLENWIFWVIIDAAAVVLYWKSGYHATIVLFMFYIVLAMYGFFSWRKVFSENRS